MSGVKNKAYEMKGALTRYEYINFMGRTAATLFLERAYAETQLSKTEAKSLFADTLCFQFWLTAVYVNYIFMQKYRYSKEYFQEIGGLIAKHYHNYCREVTSCDEKTAKALLIELNRSYQRYSALMDKKLDEMRPADFNAHGMQALAGFFVHAIKQNYDIDENTLILYFTAMIEEAVECVRDRMKKVKKIKENKT